MKEEFVLNRLRSEFPSLTWKERGKTHSADLGNGRCLFIVDWNGEWRFGLGFGVFAIYVPVTFEDPNWRKKLTEEVISKSQMTEYADKQRKQVMKILKAL